jgi:hypothetical protein
MAESVIGSKEIAIFVITVLIQQAVALTGAPFPLDPAQIYATGLTLMAIVRVIWTSGKIQSILPKQ